jgi:hypothetical protein
MQKNVDKETSNPNTKKYLHEEMKKCKGNVKE